MAMNTAVTGVHVELRVSLLYDLHAHVPNHRNMKLPSTTNMCCMHHLTCFLTSYLCCFFFFAAALIPFILLTHLISVKTHTHPL